MSRNCRVYARAHRRGTRVTELRTFFTFGRSTHDSHRHFYLIVKRIPARVRANVRAEPRELIEPHLHRNIELPRIIQRVKRARVKTVNAARMIVAVFSITSHCWGLLFIASIALSAILDLERRISRYSGPTSPENFLLFFFAKLSIYAHVVTFGIFWNSVDEIFDCPGPMSPEDFFFFFHA